MNFNITKISINILICSLIIFEYIWLPNNLLGRPKISIETYGLYANEGNEIKKVLSQLFSIVNRGRPNRAEFEEIQEFCTDIGFKELSSLLNRNIIRFENENYELELNILENRGFQIRDIKITIDADRLTDYLIFDFDERVKIDHVRFSLWGKIGSYMVEQVVSRKEQTHIERFIEEYRTAFISKDIDKINSLFSIDAEIIVGKVHSEVVNEEDKNRVDLFTRTKAEYLEKLKQVFNNNQRINPTYELIYIAKHKICREIFCVTLYQDWFSTQYSDLGWVFLLFDFSNKDQVEIFKREWKNDPKKFEDQFDFKINF